MEQPFPDERLVAAWTEHPASDVAGPDRLVLAGESDDRSLERLGLRLQLDDRAFMSQGDRPKPYQPRGAMDGKCVDSKLAADMKLWAKWGSSGEIPFVPDQFFKENPIWDYLKPYLLARPNQPWTEFKFNEKRSRKKTGKHTRKKSKKSKSRKRSRKKQSVQSSIDSQ